MLRASGKIVGRGPYFIRSGRNGAGIFRNQRHGLFQLFRGRVEICPQSFKRRNEGLVDALREIAFGKLGQGLCECLDIFHTAGHVGRKFDHLEHLAVQIEDRIIGGLNENPAATLAEPHELIRHEITPGEPFPELRIVGRLRVGGLAEHPMMPALHFRQRITEGRQKILVGRQHLAARGEFDDGLRPRQGIDLAGIFRRLQLARGNIGGNLDHFHRLAAAKHRIVGGLDPDFPAALADALILPLIELACRKLCPEGLVILRRHLSGLDKHAVMPADDFRKLITERATEVLIGGENLSGQIKFYDGLRFRERGHNRESIGTTIKKTHVRSSDGS